ncbi:MAG TPA: hypothetical protein VNT26_00285 [Candidatus Sulfotelmatobacter sp.]|nr:hypothetical protein [Candidatus Sulfotelmatobacter sp.]
MPDPKAMRVLLRSTETGRFFQSPGRWTDRLEQALDFKRGAEAIRLAYELKLQHVEILFSFENPLYNIRLPLRPEGSGQ